MGRPNLEALSLVKKNLLRCPLFCPFSLPPLALSLSLKWLTIFYKLKVTKVTKLHAVARGGQGPRPCGLLGSPPRSGGAGAAPPLDGDQCWETWNKHTKRHLFLYKTTKKLSKWAPEIDPKQIQIWTSRSPFLSHLLSTHPHPTRSLGKKSFGSTKN